MVKIKLDLFSINLFKFNVNVILVKWACRCTGWGATGLRWKRYLLADFGKFLEARSAIWTANVAKPMADHPSEHERPKNRQNVSRHQMSKIEKFLSGLWTNNRGSWRVPCTGMCQVPYKVSVTMWIFYITTVQLWLKPLLLYVILHLLLHYSFPSPLNALPLRAATCVTTLLILCFMHPSNILNIMILSISQNVMHRSLILKVQFVCGYWLLCRFIPWLVLHALLHASHVDRLMIVCVIFPDFLTSPLVERI